MNERYDRPPKSTPADWDRLDDEAAPVHERSIAMVNLCADGYSAKLVPHAEAWLEHASPLLRESGVKLLLLWRSSTAHVPVILKMLHTDPSWWVRPAIARLLVGDWILGAENRDEILGHLVRQLEVDEDEDAQMGIYGALLEALIPKVADRPKLPSDARGWDRDRDVDWSLLAPWRASNAG